MSKLTIKDAFTQFRYAADEGGVPNLDASGSRPLSTHRRDVVLSHVRLGLSLLLGLPREDLDEDVDILPLLPSLPDACADAASEADLARPGNYRANGKLFVATISPEEDRSRPKAGAREHDDPSPAWEPLYTALQEIRDQREKELTARGRPTRGRLGHPTSSLNPLRRLAASHGVDCPKNLPGYDEVLRWANEADMPEATRETTLTAYRSAVRYLDDSSYPLVLAGPGARDRGVRSVPDLQQRLRDVGCSDDPRGMSTASIVAQLAPLLGRALEESLKWGRRKNRSDAWQKAQVDATSRLVASLTELSFEVGSMSLVDVFRPTVQREVELPSGTDWLIEQALGDAVSNVEMVSPMRLAIEQMRPLAAKTSSLHVVTAPDATDIELPYVATIPRDVRYLFAAAARVYKKPFSKRQPTTWATIEIEFEAILDHIDSHNSQLQIGGHIQKKMVAGYGEMVCVALPALRRGAIRALADLDEYRVEQAARTHLGTIEDELRGLEHRADKALTNYIRMALVLDDGLRLKNYARAIGGEHLVVKPRLDTSGHVVGIEEAHTHFRGYDHSDVRLKRPTRKRRNGQAVERRRSRKLTRGIVDHDLLFRFWYETRPRNAVRRELISHVNEFDFDEDGYAVFISPKRPQNRSFRVSEVTERQKQTGRYSKDGWSNGFKTTLIEMLEAVGVEVPDVGDPTREDWRGILGPHIARSLISTYWGGLRENWSLAQFLTDDTRQVLEDHYVEIKDDIGRLLHERGPKNPRWFDQILDRIVADRPDEDWASFWDEWDPEAYDPDYDGKRAGGLE